MRVVLPGGSGQLGTILAREFHQQGHVVVVLSRSRRAAPWKVVQWDGASVGDWCQEIDGSDVVVNLAGRSVDCRYTAANRRQILESRTASARAVGEAVSGSRVPPRLWIQLSTATIYAHRFDAGNDERDGQIGGQEVGVPASWGFSVEVAKAWEAAAEEAVGSQTRLVLLRSAVVMSPDRGGIFEVMLNLVRKGLGGRSGDGRQYVSWVHDRDFVGAVNWVIANEALEGPINVSSPNPIPNREFMSHFRKAWGTRFGLPATKWMLEIGALVMRTETELVLKSRRVLPAKLLDSGFRFRFPTWDVAVRDLCQRYRES